MESDGDRDRRRAAVAAQVELLLVRLRFLEARHPGAVERAAREFEREAGGEPGAREAVALVRARFGLRAP
jgi:hypothetical protein